MQIRIKSAPVGEAPLRVREAWIGLCLPLCEPGLQADEVSGVLTHRNLGARIRRLFKLSPDKMLGYAVNAKIAVDLLAINRPDAATWWRTNTPDLLRGKSTFLFDLAACDEIGPAAAMAAVVVSG